MKPWLVVLILLAVCFGGGFALDATLGVGGLAYCITGLIALLLGIIILRKKAENANRDQVVYDDDVNVISRSRVDEEE